MQKILYSIAISLAVLTVFPNKLVAHESDEEFVVRGACKCFGICSDDDIENRRKKNLCLGGSDLSCEEQYQNYVENTTKKLKETNPELFSDNFKRFDAHRKNYVIAHGAESDEGAVEVQYSIRYLITRANCLYLNFKNKEKYKDNNIDFACLDNYLNRWELFLGYTGKFDFYWRTRDSGPVINRISNPGAYARKYYKYKNLRWFTIGYEHKSTGQTVSADRLVDDPSSADFGRYVAQVNLENGNHTYFDEISVDTDYFSFEALFLVGKSDRDGSLESCDKNFTCIRLNLGAKYYVRKDSGVYWGPLANSDVKISDYDIFTVGLTNIFETGCTVFPEIELGTVWTFGDKMFETDSFDIHVGFPIVLKSNFKVPLFIKVHLGPLNNLSDYSNRQNSYGMGLKLSF